ncbi:MAG: Co2+/Mg2+ efflux protein ApaG [Phycisphaerales bacterium]
MSVRAEPFFLAEHSDAPGGRFVFGYRIRITNSCERIIQLLSRRWTVVDAVGRTREIEGEGVVGRQPILGPGQSFQYESYCPIQTSWGTMDGAFTFRSRGPARPGETASSLLDGPWPENFEAKIGRFYLVVSPEAAGASGP